MKKIKLFIGMLLLIAFSCLFFNPSFNRVYAAATPMFDINVPENAEPGSEFNIELHYDLSSYEDDDQLIVLNSFVYVLSGDYTISDRTEWGVSFNDGEYSPLDDNILTQNDYVIAAFAADFNGVAQEIKFCFTQMGTTISMSNVETISVIIPVSVHDTATDPITVAYMDRTMYGSAPSETVKTSNEGTLQMDISKISSSFVFDGEMTGMYLTEVALEAPKSSTNISSLNINDTIYTGDTLIDLFNNGIEVDASVSELNITAECLEKANLTNVKGPSDDKTVTDNTCKVNLDEPDTISTITLTVTAQNGINTQEYSFNVKRKAYDISTLDTLNVSQADTYKSDISFVKQSEFVYNLTIGEGVEKLDIEAIPTNEYISSLLINNYTLDQLEANGGLSLNNVDTITIDVVAQDGTSKSTYTINVTKTSDDNSIESLTVYPMNGTTASTTPITLVESPTDTFTGSIGFTDVTGFKVVTEKNHDDADLNLDSDTVSFTAAKYDAETKTLSFVVTSESGIERTYTVKITREKADTSTELVIDGSDFKVVGSKTNQEYSMRVDSQENYWVFDVPSSEGTVSISAEAVKDTTTVSISTSSANNLHTVGSTKNATITVTAENKTIVRKITIVVNATKETYNEIDTLGLFADSNETAFVDKNNATFSYNSQTDEYEFNVAYEVTSVYVAATSKNGATVYINKLSGLEECSDTINLAEGENTIVVYAKSEASVDGTKYTIIINREEGDNDPTLKTLTVAGVSIIANGVDQITPVKDVYKIRVERGINSIAYSYAFNKETSSLKSANFQTPFTVDDGDVETLELVVEAQDGTTKTYKVEVSCKEDKNTINSVKVTYTDINNNEQTITVDSTNKVVLPYGAKNVSLVTETDANYATVKVGNTTATNDENTYTVSDLSVSETVKSFTISITSEYGTAGTSRVVQISVQKGDNDPTLKTLTVAGVSIIANGVDQITPVKDVYKIRVERGINSIAYSYAFNKETSSLKSANFQTPFTVDDGDVETLELVVEAQDGTTKTYKVEVSCKEDKNTINSLTVSYVDGNETITATGQKITVPYAVSKVDITLSADASYAAVLAKILSTSINPINNNDGTYTFTDVSLNEEDNNFTFNITSEYGNAGSAWTLNVYREEGNENASLKTLIIAGQNVIVEGENVITPVGGKYIVRVERGVNDISVVADVLYETSSINPAIESSYEVLDGKTLSITITVKPQVGDSKLYNVEVHCKEDKNTINSVKVTYTDINNNEQTITVDSTNKVVLPYGAKNVSLVTETDANYATVKVGNTTATNDEKSYTVSDLAVSETAKNFTISITSEFGTAGTSRAVEISVQKGDNDSTLKTLTVAGINIITNGIDQISPENDVYKIRVDRGTNSITYSYAFNKETSSLKSANYTTSFTIIDGEVLTLELVIEAQNGDTKTYRVEIACKEDKNIIEKIELIYTDIDGTDKTITTSLANPEVEIPYSATNVRFNIDTDGEYSVVKLNGDTNFSIDPNEGDNQYSIAISSEYGTVGTGYDVVVVRTEGDKDSSLSSVVIKIGETEYVGEVSATSANKINLVIGDTIVAETGTLTITGNGYNHTVDIKNNGVVDLPQQISATKSIDFRIYAENEAYYDDYTIVIQYEGADLDPNNEIDSVNIVDANETEYASEFDPTDKENTVYTITLPALIDQINITVSAVSTKSDVYIGIDGTVEKTNSKIVKFDYNQTKVITVYAISETDEQGTTYTFNITREDADHDAYLESLTVNGTAIELVAGQLDYEVVLDSAVESAEIVAVACDNATLNPKDTIRKYIALGGSVEVAITVTAQDGVTQQDYNITIKRGNTDNDITGITVSYNIRGEAVTQTVNLDTLADIIVPFAATDINVSAETNGIDVKGAGTKTPVVGSPANVQIYAVNQFNEAGSIYEFNIVRQAANTNDYLSSLAVTVDGTVLEFDEEFNKEVETYAISYVAENILNVTVTATPEYEYATVVGAGNVNLTTAVVKGNTMVITISVYSEAEYAKAESLRKPRQYVIYISRESVDLSDNNTISSITIKNGEIIYFADQFDSSVDTYELTLPYTASTFDVLATSPAAVKEFYGVGTYGPSNITNNYVEFEVYAVSNLGNAGTKYKFKITIEIPDNDSSLSDIKINSVTVADFDSEKYTYTISVANSVDKINIIPTVTAIGKASYQILVDGVTSNGLAVELTPDQASVITILVTAQDGVTKSTYTLTVTRNSDTGSVDSLYIEGVQASGGNAIIPFTDADGNPISFSKDVYEYYATVSYVHSEINVIAITSDFTIDIRGTGIIPLEVGPNEVPIDAIPRTGNVGRYTIIVIRKAEASDSTNVDLIKIDEIETFETDYIDTTNSYGLYTVASDIKELTFTIQFNVGEYEDPATYEILNNDLHYGINTVLVLVKSADHSTVRPIIIMVERKDIQVESISIDKIEGIANDFSNDKDSYNYSVDESVKNLNINLVLADENATYEISNTSLKSGDNVIEIKLMNGDEVNRIIYINVHRGNVSTIQPYDYAIGGIAIVVVLGVFLLSLKKKRKI